MQPENKEVVSFIQESKGKRKFHFISNEASNNDQSGNPSSVLLGSNLSCGSNEVNVEKNASFKHCFENFKRGFISETGLVREHNITSSATGVITEQIISKSNVSSLTHAASDDESVISSEEGTRHSFNEDTKNFLGSEKVIKNAGFGSKNILNFSRSFSKSDISPKNKETDTMSGTNYNDRQISSRAGSPVCCRNEETGANAAETLHNGDIATAEDAGPSGTRHHTHEEGNKNRFACNMCGKEFEESWKFDAHYRTHRDEKAFVCDICQKKFPQKVLLKRHYRTHPVEKPFVCDVCSRGYTEKIYLDRHYRIHTGEKPYVCDVCQKGFNRLHNLKIHCRIHTGEKPYVCVVCHKEFAHESSLKKHYRTHTGEKPFVCEICKKDFADSSNLAKHIRRHTEKKPYKCTICGKAYSDSRSCRKHYERKHN